MPDPEPAPANAAPPDRSVTTAIAVVGRTRILGRGAGPLARLAAFLWWAGQPRIEAGRIWKSEELPPAKRLLRRA